MQLTRIATLGFALCVLGAGSANAGSVFLETFDSGSPSFTTDEDIYWLPGTLPDGNNTTNGYVVKTSSQLWPFWGNNIPSDVSGTGYFLFEGTGDDNPNPALGEFYISPSFPVAPNTEYTVSFYLAAGSFWDFASVQPEIDGSLLGSPVSPAADSWAQCGIWQPFSFSWNSGSNISASLILHNYTPYGYGNDVGIDDISVATPEPGTLALAGLGFAAALLWRKRV
jgi:hypothetical protein